MNFFKKLLNDEPGTTSHWQRDDDALVCNGCRSPFTLANRRHHCRNCGYVFCAACSSRQCTVPMRNIHTKVRVCNDCYVSLTGRRIDSARASEVPSDSRAPSVLASDVRNGYATGTGNSTGGPVRPGVDDGAPSHSTPSPSAQDLAGSVAAQNSHEGTHAVVDDSTATNAASAQSNDNHDEEEAAEAVGAYQSAYGSHAAADTVTVGMNSEQAEKELLARRWAQVRREAQFVDILIQRVERVEVDTPVEYSRETEAITLQPEMAVTELARTLMPLPQPVENSARFLLDPVFPIILSSSNGSENAPGDGANSEETSRGEAQRALLKKQLQLVSARV